ncbi:hypothetical protein ACSAZK_03275 [Methanosarcina sp. Mfa9]|uniref:hypothetical protein n=1 Tax=Methanosarcina sp. Mfa9 TaxID=3439063 RepID=UPI003F839D5C
MSPSWIITELWCRTKESGKKEGDERNGTKKWVNIYKRGMGKKQLGRKWVKNDKIAFALKKRYSICLKLLKV